MDKPNKPSYEKIFAYTRCCFITDATQESLKGEQTVATIGSVRRVLTDIFRNCSLKFISHRHGISEKSEMRYRHIEQLFLKLLTNDETELVKILLDKMVLQKRKLTVPFDDKSMQVYNQIKNILSSISHLVCEIIRTEDVSLLQKLPIPFNFAANAIDWDTIFRAALETKNLAVIDTTIVFIQQYAKNPNAIINAQAFYSVLRTSDTKVIFHLAKHYMTNNQLQAALTKHRDSFYLSHAKKFDNARERSVAYLYAHGLLDAPKASVIATFEGITTSLPRTRMLEHERTRARKNIAYSYLLASGMFEVGIEEAREVATKAGIAFESRHTSKKILDRLYKFLHHPRVRLEMKCKIIEVLAPRIVARSKLELGLDIEVAHEQEEKKTAVARKYSIN